MLDQPRVSKQLCMCPLSALDSKAAYDLRGEHTVNSAAVQLYNEETVPKVLHKTPGIRADKMPCSDDGD